MRPERRSRDYPSIACTDGWCDRRSPTQSLQNARRWCEMLPACVLSRLTLKRCWRQTSRPRASNVTPPIVFGSACAGAPRPARRRSHGAALFAEAQAGAGHERARSLRAAELRRGSGVPSRHLCLAQLTAATVFFMQPVRQQGEISLWNHVCRIASSSSESMFSCKRQRA